MATDSDSKTEDGKTGSGERTYSKAEFDDVVAARQQAKAERNALADELKGIREWKEAKEREEMERKGNYEEALGALKADFEGKLAALSQENEGLKASQEATSKQQRMDSFVEAIATKAKLGTTAVRAALRELNATRGTDIHPESFDDDTIADVITLAQDTVPELFTVKDMGKAPNSTTADPKEKRLQEIVAKMKAGRPSYSLEDHFKKQRSR